MRGTFTEQARGIQIVSAAIEVIAEHGYSAASMGRIADRIGVSRALLNYHFRNREALIEAVVTEVYATGYRAVRPGMDAETTASGQLRAFIRGSVNFYLQSPQHIAALTEIIAGTQKGDFRPVAEHVSTELEAVALLFRDGQRAGEFRDFDPYVMARSVRGALDATLGARAADPDLDLDHCGDELIMLFENATKAG
ncbi:TetR family transcriptional regulator [Microlunatus endophyticus]|uniref:TetR family transcriptional regulator n=1 Tax=Microlunatus endophyticus TaxID=1716077 RepID=A0A917SCE1_9ACTN|nr:TetR/AcrR family transcriptional regulator [Microlunatus endophyticus]GGL71818.1 TetR family transcriptional regulator [Microlunatus endophyticus]